MIARALVLLLGKVGNGLLALASLAILTRLLTPDEYGKYAIAMAVATVAAGVLFQWLNVSVGRFLPGAGDAEASLLSVAKRGFWLACLATLLLGAVTIYFSSFAGIDWVMAVLVVFTVMAVGRFELTLQVLNARLYVRRYALVSVAKSLVALVLGAALVGLLPRAETALFSVLAATAIGALLGLPRIAARSASSGSFNLGSLLAFGAPLAWTFVGLLVVDFFDRIMLGAIAGVAAAGAYAAAYDLSQQLVGPLHHVAYLAMFPAVVVAYEGGGPVAAASQLRRLGCTLIGVGLPAAVGLAALAVPVSKLMFGSEVAHLAAPIIPPVALAMAIACFKSYYVDVAFQLQKKTQYQAMSTFFMAAINVLFNFLLIPQYGPLGAAWATVIAFASGAVFSWLCARRIFSLPLLWGEVARAALAVCLMLAVVLPVSRSGGFLRIAAAAVLGAAVYSAAAIALNIGGSRESLVAKMRSWNS